MMMCEQCGKNPATTHIKTVLNGVVQEQHLCAYCAAGEGVQSFGQLSLPNLLTSMFTDVLSSGRGGARRCPCCGASFADIAESGRVGCGECYSTFREQLLPSLHRLHGKALHIGATPKEEAPKPTKEDRLAALRVALADAVKAEEFEKAAALRDEIRALESEEK